MHETVQQRNSSRIAYLDNLRAIAAFVVVLVHVAAQNWYSVDISSLTWMIFNLFDSAGRWVVPVFVMVSGVVFLNKTTPVKVIFTKYVLRLVTAYVFWSLVYAVAEGGDTQTILMNILLGHFHMWFIPMMIGLYLCIPVYKKITEDDSVTRYFIALSFCISFFIPHVILLIKDFGPGLINALVISAEPNFGSIKMSMMLGYSSYFVLGYYLNKVEFSRKQQRIIYVLGIAGYLATVLMTHFASQHGLSPNHNYYNEFTVNNFFQAVAVFVFFKYHSRSEVKPNKVCAAVSRASFGIYWVHALIMELLDEKLLINTLSFFPALSVPGISIVVFVISFLISWVIGKVPFIKRYIV